MVGQRVVQVEGQSSRWIADHFNHTSPTTVLYFTVLYSMTLYCTPWYCTVLHSTVLYSFVS